jgi:uncharacterized protein (TIGR02444 family)
MSAAGPSWPPSAFWDFSLDLYRRPEVESACLVLQDAHGLDVNLVMLAAWAAHTGRRLELSLAGRLRALADAYQADVMQPLRQTRRALKAHAPSSALAPLLADRRRALLGLELDLERLEQLQLEKLLDEAGSVRAQPAAQLFVANLEQLYPGRALPAPVLAVLASTLADSDATAAPDRSSL